MPSPSWHASTPEARRGSQTYLTLNNTNANVTSTTCRGICASGRPCRRPVSSYRARVAQAMQHSQDLTYCWQHKDQVPPAALIDTRPAMRQKARATEQHVRRKNSVDTLAGRFGVMSIAGSLRRGDAKGPSTKQPQPPQYSDSKRHQGIGFAERKASMSFWRFLCGSTPRDEAYVQLVRKRPVISQPFVRQPVMSERVALPAHVNMRPPNAPSAVRSEQPFAKRWIPDSLPPTTVALLQLELAKPISPSDGPGYIYMYRLSNDAAAQGASVLHESPPPLGAGTMQRQHSVRVQGKSIDELMGSNATPGSALVKIGRSRNVHQRLSTWTSQCGYSLALLRYYPYSSGSVDSATTRDELVDAQVPWSHRVERLIHIELEARRYTASSNCPRCGKRHREWFRVATTAQDIGHVDGVVRRWVRWAQETGSAQAP